MGIGKGWCFWGNRSATLVALHSYIGWRREGLAGQLGINDNCTIPRAFTLTEEIIKVMNDIMHTS